MKLSSVIKENDNWKNLLVKEACDTSMKDVEDILRILTEEVESTLNRPETGKQKEERLNILDMGVHYYLNEWIPKRISDFLNDWEYKYRINFDVEIVGTKGYKDTYKIILAAKFTDKYKKHYWKWAQNEYGRGHSPGININSGDISIHADNLNINENHAIIGTQQAHTPNDSRYEDLILRRDAVPQDENTDIRYPDGERYQRFTPLNLRAGEIDASQIRAETISGGSLAGTFEAQIARPPIFGETQEEVIQRINEIADDSEWRPRFGRWRENLDSRFDDDTSPWE